MFRPRRSSGADGPGQEIIKTNDVFLAEDGLIYALDRLNGLDILEFTG